MKVDMEALSGLQSKSLDKYIRMLGMYEYNEIRAMLNHIRQEHCNIASEKSLTSDLSPLHQSGMSCTSVNR